MRRREGWHAAKIGELSAQQRRVLELMAAGRTNYEIGEALGLSLDGAKYHVREILGKFGVDSREEAVAAWRAERSLGRRLGRLAHGLWPLGLGASSGAAALAVAGVVVLALYASVTFDSGSGQPAAIRATIPGATAAAVTAQPTAAPDTFGELPARGTLGLLAFVREGNIWAKALPGGQEVQLTSSGQDSAPVLAPAGHWMTFRRGTDLWLLDATGKAQPLAADAAVWAPDDDRLALAKDGKLSVLDVVSGKTIDLGEGSGPAWSPDGRRIAALGTAARWTVGQPPTPLVTFDAVSGARLALTSSVAPDEGWSGDVQMMWWSGDGKEILFLLAPDSRSLAADGVRLWRVPSKGGTPVQFGQWQLEYSDYVAILPGSNMVAITAGGGREAWYGKELALAALPDAPQPVSDAPAGSAGAVSWSPDGSRLAFVLGPADREVSGGDKAHQLLMQRRVYIRDFEASVPVRKLLDDPAYRDDRATWSRDGQWLLVARFSSDDVASLWLIAADGKQAEKVADRLGPFDAYGSTWLGYYGHVQWDVVSNWRP